MAWGGAGTGTPNEGLYRNKGPWACGKNDKHVEHPNLGGSVL